MARKSKDLMDGVIADLSVTPPDWKVSNRQFVSDNFERLDPLLQPGKHSANTVANTITSKGRKISGSTLRQYMNAERAKRADSPATRLNQEPAFTKPRLQPRAVVEGNLAEAKTIGPKRFKAPRPE
jgi:hypothetical protein